MEKLQVNENKQVKGVKSGVYTSSLLLKKYFIFLEKAY